MLHSSILLLTSFQRDKYMTPSKKPPQHPVWTQHHCKAPQLLISELSRINAAGVPLSPLTLESKCPHVAAWRCLSAREQRSLWEHELRALTLTFLLTGVTLLVLPGCWGSVSDAKTPSLRPASHRPFVLSHHSADYQPLSEVSKQLPPKSPHCQPHLSTKQIAESLHVH